MTYIGIGAIHECLACERSYTIEQSLGADVPREYCETYCSKECYEVYEQALKEGADKGALIQNILDNNKQDTVTKILNHYHLKVKVD